MCGNVWGRVGMCGDVRGCVGKCEDVWSSLGGDMWGRVELCRNVNFNAFYSFSHFHQFDTIYYH